MVSIDAIDVNNIIKEAIAKNCNTVVDLNILISAMLYLVFNNSRNSSVTYTTIVISE